jgi:hypothetical protein
VRELYIFVLLEKSSTRSLIEDYFCSVQTSIGDHDDELEDSTADAVD